MKHIQLICFEQAIGKTITNVQTKVNGAVIFWFDNHYLVMHNNRVCSQKCDTNGFM